MTPPHETLSKARWAAWRRLNAHDPNLRAAAAAPEPYAPQDSIWPEISELERRDRAVAERLVKGVLQHRGLIDALIADTPGIDWDRTKPKLREILRLAVYEKIWMAQSPDYAIGAQSVDLARRAAGEPASRFVNAAVRRLMERLPADEAALKASDFYRAMPEDRRWSIPAGIVAAYREAYGAAQADAALHAMSDAAPAGARLRVNTLKISPPALAAKLAEEGVATETLSGMPEALRWTGGETRPWETEAWAKGLATVQDAGAMLAAHLLGAGAGQRVLDFCAAPGGKTGHLWERMEGKGTLVAWEPDPARRSVMAEALKRLHGPDLSIVIAETLGSRIWGKAASYDRVLVDAPCLALGLIRRHAEIRWDRREAALDSLALTQREILEAASRWVKPDGRLLWVTCSPTVAENEALVLGWLKDHPDWSVIAPGRAFPFPLPEWAAANDICLRTRPDVIHCDAFAMILIELKP